MAKRERVISGNVLSRCNKYKFINCLYVRSSIRERSRFHDQRNEILSPRAIMS